MRGITSSLNGHVGLSILQEICKGESNNIVVKYGLSSLTRTTPIISSTIIKSNVISDNVDGDYRFLRSCQLCLKPLRADKDIYMYRGDQGFCSIECRKKQIMLEENEERKSRYKRRVAISSLDCRGCETCKLLEDLRQQRHHRTKHQSPLLSIS